MAVMEKLYSGVRKLGLYLSPEQLQQFETYYQEMVDWNQRVNLTAITSYEEVQIRHFLDSLTVTLAWPPRMGNIGIQLIDVGTGAGIPGLPLKILFPEIKLTLLEAVAKKAAFLLHLKQKLRLDNVEVITGRAEGVAHLSPYRERFDLVLSRAVASLPTLVELTLPFCALGGIFIAQKKGIIDQEVNRGARAISRLGGRLREVKRVELEAFTDERYLVVVDKLFPTPLLYPRRSGLPAKKPVLD